MYDPVVKVPLIIKFPGNRPRGITSTSLASTVDIAPTIVRQVGLQPGGNMHGLDLGRSEKREFLFAEGENQLMARTQTHKLILRTPAEKSLFFDLQSDPFELKNLFGEARHAQEIARLSRAIASWRDPGIKPKPYLDETAPVVRGPNVPPRDDKHRQEMIDYFRKKMDGRG